MAKSYTRKGQIANGVAIKPLNEGERNVSALAKGGAGGGNVEVVTFTKNGGVFSADMTYAEITAAIEAGKTVLGVYSNMSVANAFLGVSGYEFTFLSEEKGALVAGRVVYASDGTITT